MPSRTTRKSTRPRVADRTMVDTVQPRVLASFRNRSALSLLMNMQLLRWSKAKPETTGQDTRLERHSYLTKGLDAANHNRASGGGRRMFLTSPLSRNLICRGFTGIKRPGLRPPLIGNRVGPLSCVRTGAVGFYISARSSFLLCRYIVDRTSTFDRRVGRADGPWP